MKILRVKKSPVYDVFTGEGWFNWTRIIVQSSGLKIIGGVPLIPSVKAEIQSALKGKE
jgi:hypothetical protein